MNRFNLPAQQTDPVNFQELPCGIKTQIVSYLPFKEVMPLRILNKSFAQAGKDARIGQLKNVKETLERTRLHAQERIQIYGLEKTSVEVQYLPLDLDNVALIKLAPILSKKNLHENHIWSVETKSGEKQELGIRFRNCPVRAKVVTCQYLEALNAQLSTISQENYSTNTYSNVHNYLSTQIEHVEALDAGKNKPIFVSYIPQPVSNSLPQNDYKLFTNELKFSLSDRAMSLLHGRRRRELSVLDLRDSSTAVTIPSRHLNSLYQSANSSIDDFIETLNRISL